MPSSWKSLPMLQHYLAELHMEEALLLFSINEERVTDHFPLFWPSRQWEVKVAFSASSSAHREHCCLCAAAEFGNVLGSCSDNPWHSAATGLSGFMNGLKRAFLPWWAFPSDVELIFPVVQGCPRLGQEPVRISTCRWHSQCAGEPGALMGNRARISHPN